MLYFSGQLVPVTLMKGSLGFGFTLAAIAVNGYQVQVKDILDRDKCQQLQSGDVIASVNGKATVNVTKEQVVAMLKGCPENQLAFLTVLRGVQIANDRQLKQSLSNSSQNNTENCKFDQNYFLFLSKLKLIDVKYITWSKYLVYSFRSSFVWHFDLEF